MIEAYGKFIVFESEEEKPTCGIVLSIGEDVKGISIEDTIYMMDYATFPMNNKKIFSVNREHILAIKKSNKYPNIDTTLLQ